MESRAEGVKEPEKRTCRLCGKPIAPEQVCFKWSNGTFEHWLCGINASKEAASKRAEGGR